MDYLYGLTVALFLTIALIPVLIRFSARLGLVDDPSAERKVHSVAMPRTGGLGIIIGVALPLLFLIPLEGLALHLTAGSAVIIIFGLLDDRMELSYKWKLFGQALGAVIVMSGGVVIEQFPFFGFEQAPVWLTYPVTFFFLVGVVNGVNFSDGLDGLAAGTSIMALLLIFVLSLQCGDSYVALVSLTIVGGVLGFLRYNTFPANIFMGDAGSQFLGFIIACLAVVITQSDASPYSTLLPVLILGIPIMDIIQVVPVRVHKKLPLPGPDKEHFHHQLSKLGFSHTRVVGLIYLLQTILLSGAYFFRHESDVVVALVYGSFVVLILGGLLLSNAFGWRYGQAEVSDDVESSEKRNRLLRHLNWYYHNSARTVAVLLGSFFVFAAWLISPDAQVVALLLAVVASAIIAIYIARFRPGRGLFRVVLYVASVLFAYWITLPEIANQYGEWLLGYLAVLLLCLMLGIRMTRKKEFSLTTQDLLILLVVVLMPLLPFDILDQLQVSRIALAVAVLMYASEFVLIRDTKMVAVSAAFAVSALSMVLFVGF